MRRLVLLTAGLIAVMLAGAAPASADNGPHEAGKGPLADTCGACHRVHTAKAPRLLKEDQTNLCFTCHGAGGAGAVNDVQSGVGAGGGALRGGGFDYALIDAGNPSGTKSSAGVIPVSGTPEATTSTHSTNSSSQTIWGWSKTGETPQFGKAVTLSCGNCHDPHGNGNYRILRTTPRGIYSKGETAPEVAIADASEKVYTTTNYWLTSDAKGLEFAEKIAAWCSICHTRYKAHYEGSVDSGDPVYTYRHTSDYGEQGPGKRTCVQCHVSHGSNASMGATSRSVPFPDGSGAGTPDSRLLRADNRGVCQICHNK